jgi:hypothetical protein
VIKQLFRIGCVGLLACAASGCVALAAVASKVQPPPKMDAEYKPAKKPTLVFVENFENPDLYEVESNRIARDISYEFTENKSFPVVPPQKLIDLRGDRSADFSKMKIPEVARAVGADQVIYVNLRRFTADPPTGSETVQGRAEAVVKFVDAKSGQTLWPRDSFDGRVIAIKTPALSAEGTTRDAVQEQLYQGLSEEISHLFYDWVNEKQGDDGPPSITGDDIK